MKKTEEITDDKEDSDSSVDEDDVLSSIAAASKYGRSRSSVASSTLNGSSRSSVGSNQNGSSRSSLASSSSDVLPPLPPPSGAVLRVTSTQGAVFPKPLRRSSIRNRSTNSVAFDRIALMRSIRRGSVDWRAMMRPFVSSLAFRCIWKRRMESEIAFSSWSGYAAVLFVDLSGYSRITAALAHKGAHLISTVVNSYLERLLHIVQAYGGDVVKFAGDAVLIAWECDEQDSMADCVLCAAYTAIKMQERCGEHPVQGTNLSFRVHMGLACGRLDTEVFEATTTESMQRLYHSVSGEPLREIGELVDLAKAGEVCVSHRVMTLLGKRGTYRHVGNDPYQDARLLERLSCSDQDEEKIDEVTDRLTETRNQVRIEEMEEEFVHPSVLNLLVHSGNAPTQIAQMRNLCVLFIAMTSKGSSGNWLNEVQGVLDKHRCPIVQIIDDDKGVHIVAAINLYVSTPEATTLALQCCRELLNRKVGCAIGLAMGSTFCGCHGSNKFAVRWDITGPPPVRAARLMQWALDEDQTVAIDESVYENTKAANQMTLLSKINVKGTSEPIPVFGLSDSTSMVASMIVEHMALAPVHEKVVEEVVSIIKSPKPRGIVVVTGPPLSGKKSVLQRAAGLCSLVPVLHVCDSGAGHLQLARTIATWYAHCNHDEVRALAKLVLDNLDKHHWTRAHEDCVHLFNIAIIAGFYGCFIVDRCQFLDEFSLSLIRECVCGSIRTKKWALRNLSRHRSNSDSAGSLTSSISETSVEGKVFFLCTHRPLYHWRTEHCFVHDVRRSRDFDVPVFRVGEVGIEDLRAVLWRAADLDCDEDWLHLYAQQCGYSIGYFFKLVETIRLISSSRMRKGERGLSVLNEKLQLTVAGDMARHVRAVNVTQVSAEVGMRFVQGYDELPPRHQTLMKVVAIATRDGFYKCPFSLAGAVMDDLFDDGVELSFMKSIVLELEELYMLKVEYVDADMRLMIRSPAITDVVLDVCTPLQITSISNALLGRFAMHRDQSYKVELICATLCGYTKSFAAQKKFWKRSYETLQKEAEKWTTERFDRHRLHIVDNILDSGGDPQEILGLEQKACLREKPALVPRKLMVMKNYSAPIGFGPMGHTYTVIIRNAFREYRTFSLDMCADVKQVRSQSKDAFDRIKDEIRLLENFLHEFHLETPEEDLELEEKFLEQMAAPATCKEEVWHKADILLENLVPKFTRPRLERLYKACKLLREKRTRADEVMSVAPEPIQAAYEALCFSDVGHDSAQNALVILAAENWVPRRIPEDLPVFHYQTTFVVRNAVMRRLNAEEVDLFLHQQGVDDLEAFLVSTALVNPFICFRHTRKWT